MESGNLNKVKSGLRYFSIDCNILDDEKIRLVKGDFGHKGFIILIYLWIDIYRTDYFIRWTEEDLLLFVDKHNFSKGLVSDVVKACLKRGLFNQKLYDEHEVLTSKNIQERYFDVCNQSKRSTVKIKEEVLLIDPDDYPNIKHSVVSGQKSRFSTQKSRVSGQSKVKVNNNILKEYYYPQIISAFWEHLKFNHPKIFSNSHPADNDTSKAREIKLANRQKSEKQWNKTAHWLLGNNQVGVKYSEDEIIKLINWLRDDDFWWQQVQSMEKLVKIDTRNTKQRWIVRLFNEMENRKRRVKTLKADEGRKSAPNQNGWRANLRESKGNKNDI